MLLFQAWWSWSTGFHQHVQQSRKSNGWYSISLALYIFRLIRSPWWWTCTWVCIIQCNNSCTLMWLQTSLHAYTVCCIFSLLWSLTRSQISCCFLQSHQGRQSQWVWIWTHISPKEASWRDITAKLASRIVAIPCPLCVSDRQAMIKLQLS